MKKVLATVAALGLVVGVTANALALDQPSRATQVESTTAPAVPQPTAPGVALWSVSGQWVLAGAYLSQGLGLPFGAAIQTDSNQSDAAYIYSFKVLPDLRVNDKISVKGEIRFADRDIFGWTDTGLTPVIENDKVLKNSGRLIDTYQLYMEWVSPWGKTRFGRTPAGAWGTQFIDNSAQGDRLMWWLNMMPENWGMLLFTQKVTEQEAADDQSDEDKDAYYVDLSYKAPFGKTTGALWAVRDATNDQKPYTTTNFWLTGNYIFDALTLEYELNWGFGDGANDTDVKTLAFYANADYKVQDWKFSGIFFYLTGDDDPNDTSTEAAMSNATGTGKDFNPYQILTGDYMRILNGDMGGLTADTIHPAIKNGSGNAGAWSLGGKVAFNMSPTMSFYGVVGYAGATAEPEDYDNDYGWELGAGMGYKIMDNLMYNAHFSYMITGDYFKEGVSDAETTDVWLIAHALSMSF
jgi:hypothetical protein